MLCLVAQLCPTLCDPMDYSSQGSMGFSRQEYWSGSPFPPPGYLPNPGIEPKYPALQADSLLPESPGKPLVYLNGMEMAISLCDSFLHLNKGGVLSMF